MRKFKVIGSGICLPSRKISAEDLDEKMGLPVGTVYEKTKIKNRFYCDVNENAVQLGADALFRSLQDANLELHDLDAVISTSGTAYQEIPYMASLILNEYESKYKQKALDCMAFDINATCLSFAVGLDMISYPIQAGRFKKVALISAERSSNGLNYKSIETAPLFGDGAAAFIISTTDEDCGLIHADFKIFPEGANYCQVTAGGSRYSFVEQKPEDFLFQMDGKKVFKLAYDRLPSFLKTFFSQVNIDTIDGLDVVIPHQASAQAMEIMRIKLNIPKDKWLFVLEDYGNIISASLPLVLHKALKDGTIKKGHKVLMLGTSAGVSLGAGLLQF